MQRHSVSSSNISSIGYENGILEIEFHGNRIYQYNVPQSVYDGLMSASSHGKYFAEHIKNFYRPIRIS